MIYNIEKRVENELSMERMAYFLLYQLGTIYERKGSSVFRKVIIHNH